MRATPSLRVGSGPPLVLLHGFIDTWRTWELVLPALQRHHEVLALTLAGHWGGPAIEGVIDDHVLADAVERALDAAGFERAHIAGNSLGGYVALQLAARDRAETVVALAPAGGWADDAYKATLGMQTELIAQAKELAPHADAIVSTPEGRRRATRLLTERYEHIPADLLAHQLRGIANAPAAVRLIEHGLRAGFAPLDAEKITCPVRIVWGTRGQAAAVAFSRRAVPLRLAPPRRLGRARRRRPLPPARRPARDGAADPRLHLGGSDSA